MHIENRETFMFTDLHSFHWWTWYLRWKHVGSYVFFVAHIKFVRPIFSNHIKWDVVTNMVPRLLYIHHVPKYVKYKYMHTFSIRPRFEAYGWRLGVEHYIMCKRNYVCITVAMKRNLVQVKWYIRWQYMLSSKCSTVGGETDRSS